MFTLVGLAGLSLIACCTSLIAAVSVSLSRLTGVSCGIGLLAAGLATLPAGAGGRP